MGWGEPHAARLTQQSIDQADLAKWQDAYDRLWHRCRHNVPDLTTGLPTPHELRSGQGPSDVLDGLRRGFDVVTGGDAGASSATRVAVGQDPSLPREATDRGPRTLP